MTRDGRLTYELPPGHLRFIRVVEASAGKVGDRVDSSVPEINLFLSILTLGEIYKGIAKLYPGEKKEKLMEWVEHDLKTRFEARIVNLNEEIVKTWSDITGEAERRGKKWPVLDTLPASTALANHMVFVTRNIHHVEELGVKVLDPWEQ